MTLSSGSGQFSGQRAQKPHLVRGTGGLAAEVADLRTDIQRDMVANVAMAVDEFTDEPVADVDAIVVALATVAAPVTLSGADLDGVVGDADMDAPRNISFTTSGVTAADAPANAVVTGKDINGDTITETVTVPQTATTTFSVKAFKSVTTVAYPAADGTDALVAVGFGPAMGLSKPLISRAGLEAVVHEIEAGAVVTTGTFVDAATSGPHGTYEPATPQDGEVDYAVYYEYDASQNS